MTFTGTIDEINAATSLLRRFLDWDRAHRRLEELNAKVEDLDFNPDDFVARVNSDLIGKYVNIASRAAKFITERFDGQLAPVWQRGLDQPRARPDRRPAVGSASTSTA